MESSRFKFRVWDTEINEYLVGCFLVGGGNMIHDSVDYESFLNKGNFVIEQCTGLKDKNGNLIYEGDVIQNYNKDKYVVEWCIDGYWHIRQVDDEKFGCALASIKTLYDGWEIIGNVHTRNEE